MPLWRIEYEGAAFERFLRSLAEHEQAVLIAAIEQILMVYGIDICSGEWGKPLGDGLFEFRVRKSLRSVGGDDVPAADAVAEARRKVLIRVFCSFYGDKVVLLHHGYDKGRDTSAKRQQREIAKARRIYEAWRRRRG